MRARARMAEERARRCHDVAREQVLRAAFGAFRARLHLVKRLLHQPTLNLKGRGDEQQTYAYVQALRELFGLETERRSAFDTGQAQDQASPSKGQADVTSIQSRRRRQGR